MSARTYVVILLIAAAAAALVSRTVLVSVLVAGCTSSLLIGYMRHSVLATLVAGLLLYPVLAAATLTTILPFSWSCLLSGLFLIVVCERLTFEYDMSEVLESPTGVDSESNSLALELSKGHAKKMASFVALAGVVIVGSAAASALTTYAPELIGVAMLLMLAVFAHVRR